MTLLPDLVAIGLWLALVASLCVLVSIVVSWRLLWNVADPLLLVFVNVGLNVAIVVVLADARQESAIAYVLAGFVAFLAGLHTFRSRRRADEIAPALRAPGRGATLLLLGTAAALYLVYDAFIISQVGIGVFGSENPDIAKVTVTQGGYGVFRHLYVAANLFYLPLLVHSFVVYRRRSVLVFGALLFLIQNLVFNFSKAGFVFAIFDLGLLAQFYQNALGKRVLSLRLAGLVALVGLVPALLVLGVVSALSGVSILQMVLTRLAATGSGTYMYFVLDGSAAFYHMELPARLVLFFDVLLSSLRLKPWAPLSFPGMVSTHLTGVELPGFGANPYPFVAGHFLFGWGGVLYCFGVGALLSFARTRRANLLVFYIMNQSVLVFVADPGITQAYVIALLVIAPAVFLVNLVAWTQRRRLLVPVRVAYARWVERRIHASITTREPRVTPP
ncbi:MAG: hypothetical protein ACJ79A_10805 [Gemmatimonadaceae bacterium]